MFYFFISKKRDTGELTYLLFKLFKILFMNDTVRNKNFT